MEYIIGIIVLFIVYTLLTPGKKTRQKIISAINNIIIMCGDKEETNTVIDEPFNNVVKYAVELGGKYNIEDSGPYVVLNKIYNNIEYQVYIAPLPRKTFIGVTNMNKGQEKLMKYILGENNIKE